MSLLCTSAISVSLRRLHPHFIPKRFATPESKCCTRSFVILNNSSSTSLLPHNRSKTLSIPRRTFFSDWVERFKISWVVRRHKWSMHTKHPDDLAKWFIIPNIILSLPWWLEVQWLKEIELQDHATASIRNLDEGRWWTLITSGFCQRDASELAINMITFYTLYREVLIFMGTRRFLWFYFTSILVSSLSHVAWENRPSVRDTDRDTGGLGAGGPILGIAIMHGLTYPKRLMYAYGVLPFPSIMLVGAYVLYELSSLIPDKKGNVHIGHLPSGIYALLYWYSLRRINKVYYFLNRIPPW